MAAFHDVEDVDSEVVIETKMEEDPESIEVITVIDSGDEGGTVSDSDSVDKKEKLVEVKEDEPRPKREKATRKTCEYSVRPRKSRTQQDYVRKRPKRNLAKSHKDRRSKNTQKQEEFDYATFDFTYFSELSEEDKCLHLAMKNLIVCDDIEGTFKPDNFKLVFVYNCDSFVYRQNCLSRAKEIHQQVSEIKTSNFNAWHRVWLERYVTPTMLKFCNDWLLRSDPEKFKLVCITMSDCTKPPYIPYSKYRVRYYRTDS